MQPRLRLPSLPGGLTRRHILRAAFGAAALCVLVVLGANAYVVLSVRGASTDDISSLPHSQAAVVPGALVHEDGRMSSMLADRVARTVELWEAGKVDAILVSGDHGQWTYDEPDTMRNALLDAGVPARVIFTDHAGFNTRATMVRAREVFKVESAIVVTQGFHMDRALYLGEAAGMEVHGLTSDLSGYGNQGAFSQLREIASRVKAMGEETMNRNVMLGPAHPITGDGRESWGPAPPPGTPPAGAPRR
jgi:SanA protein